MVVTNGKALFKLLMFVISAAMSGCVAVPATDATYVGRCGLSTERKVLKIVDVAKTTNSYYSISGYLLTPILLPTTAIISGVYVITNNAYYEGESIIQC